MNPLIVSIIRAVVFFLAGSLSLCAWRSSLYLEDWVPSENVVFNQDWFLQDFSYAGYRYSEQPLPAPAEPIFDVRDFGADPAGTADSTVAIQAAIDAAVAAGGGVVYLPEGLYRVAPPTGADSALLIDGSNVILHGDGFSRTYVLNTATDMRRKAVIEVGNGSQSWLNEASPRVPVTADLTGPTVRIPVTSLGDFQVGESVVIHAEATPAWIAEHQMDSASLWLGQSTILGGVAYFREIVGIDTTASELVVDTPIRYSLKTRDNAAVFRTLPQLAEVGIEHLSLGNVEHPGTTGWSENDYNSLGKSAYDVHDSWLIRYRNVRHGWIRGVHSFEPSGNTLGTHMLSNGILLRDCRNITVRDCDLQKVQYGGGGGNGYTYRFQDSQECLLANSAARFQRHGIVQSHMRNSGNVFYRVLTQDTRKQTAGSGSTGGGGSDHHMHFSQAMLFDMAEAERDYYDAAWRSDWGTIAHGLTTTQSVYWNTYGVAPHSSKSYLVNSDQYGHGYVVGTSGPNSSVRTTLGTSRNSPVDFTEGVGQGATLEPVSLFLDQLNRRTGLSPLPPQAAMPAYLHTLYSGSVATALLSADVDWGVSETAGRFGHWRQLSGPSAAIADSASQHTLVHLPEPGIYEFTLHVDNGWFSGEFELRLELTEGAVETVSTEAFADSYVRGYPYDDDNYGTAEELLVKYPVRTEIGREAYFLFPTTDLPDSITAAEIELTVVNAGEQPPVEAFLASGAWTESTLTWNNKPIHLKAIDTFIPSSGVVKISVDLADLEALRSSGAPLNLGLRTYVETTAITGFASRESADAALHPRLLVRVPGGSPYLAWAKSAFGDAVVADSSLELTLWGEDADPDQDGVENAFECLQGSDPMAASTSPLRILPDRSVRFSVRYGTPFPVIEISSDGVDWNALVLEDLSVAGLSPTSFEVEAILPDADIVMARLRTDF